ncbi:delta subunit of the central stalk of mitochondrial F1F0 ATP synthase, atp16 [Bonamia ostreae]|uniref:Delta subunit of the central stalk of mitochondrial F1F0 ATP synthase, atp16 n=1 Tax=Bonamia ostreae TaxID=126728 RepID=A0ABV2APB9_9EUKA
MYSLKHFVLPNCRTFRKISSRSFSAAKKERTFPKPTKQNVIPNKLKLTFSTPTSTLYKDVDVTSIYMSTADGMMTINGGHIPTIQELIPGIMRVHDEDGARSFLVSSGYATLHADSSAEIMAFSAIKFEDIDENKIKQGESLCKESAKSEDEKIANEAKLELEVYKMVKDSIINKEI